MLTPNETIAFFSTLMERIVDVAAYVVEKYKALTGTSPDEMKLHKLLYFVQRTYLDIHDTPLFPEEFEAWRMGPVNREVRMVYCEGEIVADTKEISNYHKQIVDKVITEYGQYSPWKLSELTHNEISWQNARKGLNPSENGNVPLKVEDIIADADRERPYDMETYQEWLKLGEEDPYFNKAMCKSLAKAEKAIEMGRVVIKTMAELEAME